MMTETSHNDVIPMVRPDGNMRTLAEIEAAAIDYALLKHRSRTAAATALGIGRTTLYRWLTSPEDAGSRLKRGIPTATR